MYGRPVRLPPRPALRSVATAAAALPIGGPGQRGPAAVAGTPGSVPATLHHSTADREGTGVARTIFFVFASFLKYHVR